MATKTRKPRSSKTATSEKKGRGRKLMKEKGNDGNTNAQLKATEATNGDGKEVLDALKKAVEKEKKEAKDGQKKKTVSTIFGARGTAPQKGMPRVISVTRRRGQPVAAMVVFTTDGQGRDLKGRRRFSSVTRHLRYDSRTGLWMGAELAGHRKEIIKGRDGKKPRTKISPIYKFYPYTIELPKPEQAEDELPAMTAAA